MNAWGVWCNNKVSEFDFGPAVAAGCSFAIGQMNTGWKQYNPHFADFVQAAYDAGLRNIGGVYRVNPNEYEKMVDLLVYLQYPHGKFDANFPVIKEIYEMVRNKYLSFLVIEFGDWWIEDGTLEHRISKRVAREWYRSGAVAIVDYLRDHIRDTNHRIDDRIIPMFSRWTIDNVYPELKGLFAGEQVVSDFNTRPSPAPLASYSSTVGMTRPPKPMEVSYGSDWSFVRWANGAFITPDFDGAIGIADYHGSPAQLAAWTGQLVGNVPPVVEQPDEPEPPEPNEPPDDVTDELIDELATLVDCFERISVEAMGAKHTVERIIELLEE
ncbi:MAG: hypothetical protein KKD01_20025 [Proteobacteria bacterium]|nr:hypothetical protein [Pseudomonadota bacterium]